MYASDPEILGIPTENWAFGSAALALLISGLSFWLSAKSFRRSGARIRLELTTGRMIPIPGKRSGSTERVLRIVATNEGMARVQARNLLLEVKDRAPIFPFDYHTGEMPAVVEGFHQTVWALRVAAMPFDRTTEDVQEVRAAVTFAGLGQVKSDWVPIQFLPTGHPELEEQTKAEWQPPWEQAQDSGQT